MTQTHSSENIIQIDSNGRMTVPDFPSIPFISGDGIGSEVWPAARIVIESAIQTAYSGQRQIVWKEVFGGEKAYSLLNTWLPDETISAFRRYHVGIKGPLTTPIGEGIQSVNVALRKELDLYACFRPIRYIPGVPSPLKEPEKVLIDLFRENVEDLYVGIDYALESEKAADLRSWLKTKHPDDYARLRFPETTAFGIKPMSKDGSERIMRAAINHALKYGHRKITISHKGNIMKYTEGAFARWGFSVAEREYSDQVYTIQQYKKSILTIGQVKADLEKAKALNEGRIFVNDILNDAMFEHSISHPEDFDVVVTTNTNGDNLADALAAMVGGIGISPGANINYVSGDAIFEATHGTAPTLAGKGLANPSSLILSGALMLRYLGWDDAGSLIEKALRSVIKEKNVTADFASNIPGATKLTTSEFASAVVNTIQN